MNDIPQEPTTVRVDLGTRSYDILIGPGLIDQLGQAIADRYGIVRAGIVSDSHVAPIYLARLEASLRAHGIEPVSFAVEAGEASKRLPVFETLVEDVVGSRLERGDVLIALGGGVGQRGGGVVESQDLFDLPGAVVVLQGPVHSTQGQ